MRRRILLIGLSCILLIVSLVVFDRMNARNTAPMPVPSVSGGYYENGFTLRLTAPSNGNIYYTTDGSTPTTDLFGKVLDRLPDWKKAGVQIVMDFSVFSEDPEYHCRDIFPYVDYVFLSYDGKKDDHIRRWVQDIHSYGPKLVTATMGELGSICYDGKQLHEYGIVPAKVVNTVGAGDSYIAGFTYGILQGWDVPACMKKGAEVSSAVVSKFEPY